MATKAGRPAQRRVCQIVGQVPELMAVPPTVRRLALPEIVAEGRTVAQEEAPKKRGASSSKSIVKRIYGFVEKDSPIGHIIARAPHSHLIELGVQPHPLLPGSSKWPGRARRKRRGHKMLIGGNPALIRSSAWHPGSRANPFMQRTERRLPPIAERALAKAGQQAFDKCLVSAEKVLNGLG